MDVLKGLIWQSDVSRITSWQIGSSASIGQHLLNASVARNMQRRYMVVHTKQGYDFAAACLSCILGLQSNPGAHRGCIEGV
jgi:hypothetical protein